MNEEWISYWAWYARKVKYTNDTNGNNGIEGVNNKFKSRCTKMVSDKSLANLVVELIYVFPGEQEDDYTYSNAKQSMEYRTTISNRINPKFLNRPKHIIAHLVHNEEYAENFEVDDVKQLKDSPIYLVSKSLTDRIGKKMVDFAKGKCDCTMFRNKRKIPCPHMFGVIKHTDLTLDDLPQTLMENPMMTLNLDNKCHDILDENNLNHNVPPDVGSEDIRISNLLARGTVGVVSEIAPHRTDKQLNRKWRDGIIEDLKEGLTHIYRLTDPVMNALRENGEDKVMREHVRSVIKMADSHNVSGNGRCDKVHRVKAPKDIEYKLAKSKNLDVKRLSTRHKVKKNVMKNRIKKRVYRKKKQSRKCRPTLSKQTEDIQRKRILEEKETLQNILDDDKLHKEYKTKAKLPRAGPKRRSKRLLNKSAVDMDMDNKPSRKRRKC